MTDREQLIKSVSEDMLVLSKEDLEKMLEEHQSGEVYHLLRHALMESENNND